MSQSHFIYPKTDTLKQLESPELLGTPYTSLNAASKHTRTPVTSPRVSICESTSSSSTIISNKHNHLTAYLEQLESLELLGTPYMTLQEAATHTVTPAAVSYPSICHTISVSDSIASNKQSPPTAYPKGLKSLNLLSTPHTSLDAFSTDTMTSDASPRVSICDTIASDAAITSNKQDKPSAYLEGLESLEFLDTVCTALNEIDTFAIIPSGLPRVSIWDSTFNSFVDDNRAALELIKNMGHRNASEATLDATITSTKTPDNTSRASVYLNATFTFVDNNFVAPEPLEIPYQFSIPDAFSTPMITPTEFTRVSACDIITGGKLTTPNKQIEPIAYLDELDCLGSLDTLYTALNEIAMDTVSPVELACDFIQNNISASIVDNFHAALELFENQKQCDNSVETPVVSPRVFVKDTGSSSVADSGHVAIELPENLEQSCILDTTVTRTAVSAVPSSAFVSGTSTNGKATVLSRKSQVTAYLNLLKSQGFLVTA